MLFLFFITIIMLLNVNVKIDNEKEFIKVSYKILLLNWSLTPYIKLKKEVKDVKQVNFKKILWLKHLLLIKDFKLIKYVSDIEDITSWNNISFYPFFASIKVIYHNYKNIHTKEEFEVKYLKGHNEYKLYFVFNMGIKNLINEVIF